MHVVRMSEEFYIHSADEYLNVTLFMPNLVMIYVNLKLNFMLQHLM